MRKTYSPSAGKLCTTDTPPRVPKRRPLDLSDLRGGLRSFVPGLGGLDLGIADGLAADSVGCAQVRVHQRRRQALDVRDVVEAVADGVGGEERFDVHFEGQQVFYGAGVLGTVEPLKGATTGVRVARGGSVDSCCRRFPGTRSRLRARVGARTTAASCPCEASAGSSPRFPRRSPGARRRKPRGRDPRSGTGRRDRGRSTRRPFR